MPAITIYQHYIPPQASPISRAWPAPTVLSVLLLTIAPMLRLSLYTAKHAYL